MEERHSALRLADSHLEDAPWPATRDELIDYAIRSGSPLEVIENLLPRVDCLMIGGDESSVGHLQPAFAALAPGLGDIPRTNDGSGEPKPSEQGYLHCGPAGAGHFVKMVHNGIEYALMAAYAEGFNLLKHAGIGKHNHDVDAETSPLSNPEHYQYDIDVAEVAELWRRGSVVASWLLDLTAASLQDDPELGAFGGRVSDSGEGRWTSIAAISALQAGGSKTSRP